MSPGGLLNRFVGWCFGILAATFALYCAVKLIEAIWPTLVVIVGTLTIFAAIIRVVVYFTSRNSW